MRRLALLACIAVVATPSLAASPRLLKTPFKSALLAGQGTGSKPVALDKGAASELLVLSKIETTISVFWQVRFFDTPTDNAILKVVVPIQAGDDQTFMDVLVDTGSGILWVGGEVAYVPGPNSNPLGADFSIGYSVGGAQGIAYTDTVTIGQATVKSQIIGAANSTVGFDMVSPIGGIIGLGPPGSNAGDIIGNNNSTPTFVESLAAEGTIDQAMFGIYFNGLDPVSGDEIGHGEITFGGVDETKITGDVVWLRQIEPIDFRWSFNVSSLSFGSTQLVNTTMPGLTDTGVLSIGLPFDSIFDLLPTIPGATIVEVGPLGVSVAFPANASASTLPPISIGLGDQTFNISASQYLIPQALYPSFNLTQGDALYSWISSAGPGSYSLGQKWLEGIYSAYDLTGHRVGFAHLA